jgi:hypothetical protein
VSRPTVPSIRPPGTAFSAEELRQQRRPGFEDEGTGLIDSEDWRATLEVDPETNELYVFVRGTLVFATPGFSARLLTHKPQGLNTRTLLLDLDIIQPAGPQAQVITRRRVRFVADRCDLTDVVILTTGVDIPVGAVA